MRWRTKGKQVLEGFPFGLTTRESKGTMDPYPCFSADMVQVLWTRIGKTDISTPSKCLESHQEGLVL
jgi:hypothetical protein